MKILIVGKFSTDQFGFHIADTLKDMGHLTINFEPTLKDKYYKNVLLRRIHQANQFISSGVINLTIFRECRKNRLKKILENQKVDLTILTYDFLYPDEISFIKESTKAPIALWFPDSIANFGKAFFLIAEYDALFFKDAYIVRMLREQYNKKNVFYLPECCNPKYHKSISLNEDDLKKYACDITTYGNPHSVRSSFFTQLHDHNYSIKIWGHQPAVWLAEKKLLSLYTGEYVYNEEKAKAVLSAKINLNTLHPTEIEGLNARTFEVAGIGGFQMIHWRPGLTAMFEDGKELVSFSNFDELIEKIDFYLARPDERDKIAKAGSERVFSEHTYQHRLQLLLKTIFEDASCFVIP